MLDPTKHEGKLVIYQLQALQKKYVNGSKTFETALKSVHGLEETHNFHLP